jgi:hypothetical protein
MSEGLYIRNVEGRGRGVFSEKAFETDDLIESCPIIILEPEDFAVVTATFLGQYCFFWDRDAGILCIALGFGSVYNHSYPSNANYFTDPETGTIDIVAVRSIAPGEEITINYTGDPDNPSRQWFTGKNIPYT